MNPDAQQGPTTRVTDPGGLADAARRFASCRPYSVSEFVVEHRIACPGIQVEVRRYRWAQPAADATFSPAVSYIDLALSHRPSSVQSAFLGEGFRTNFAPVGDCVFIPAGHEIRARNPAVEHRVVACLFDAERLQPYVDWTWRPLEVAACRDIRDPHIRAALVRLADEARAPGFASTALVESTVTALMVDLARHFRQVRAPLSDRSGKLSVSQLRRIEERVAASLGIPPHMTELAAACGISTRHLSRMFKSTAGVTLSDFIAGHRIRLAKRRLADPHASIKSIAYECGFSNPSSFTAAFRRATGRSPREYRSQVFDAS